MKTLSNASSPIRLQTERIVCAWLAEGIPIDDVAYACDMTVTALRTWLTSTPRRREIYREACEIRYPDLVREMHALAEEIEQAIEARRAEPEAVDVRFRRAA